MIISGDVVAYRADVPVTGKIKKKIDIVEKYRLTQVIAKKRCKKKVYNHSLHLYESHWYAFHRIMNSEDFHNNIPDGSALAPDDGRWYKDCSLPAFFLHGSLLVSQPSGWPALRCHK